MIYKPYTKLLLIVAFLSTSVNVNALTLYEAYQKSAVADASYAAMVESLTATQEQPVQASAQLKPTVSMTLTQRKETYSLPSGSTSSGADETSSSQYVQMSQPVYNRKLWYSVDAADKRVEVAVLKLNQSLQDVVLRVTDAYMAVLLYQESLRLSEQQVATTQTRLEQVNAAMNVGYASTVDVYGLQAELDDIKSRQLLDEQQLLVAKRKLQVLMGEASPNTLVMPVLNTDIVMKQFLSDKSRFLEAVDTNLTVRIKDAELASTRSDLDVRLSEHYPSMNLGAFYSNTQASNYFAQKFDDKVVYLEVSMPIYQGGYVNSRVREGEAMVRSLQKEAEFARRDAAKKIQEQLSAVTTAAERLKAIEKAIDSGGVYLASVEDGFRLGLRDITEVSRAKEKLFANKRDKIKTTVDFVNALINLHTNTGLVDDDVIKQISDACWRS
jgi:TolC family type I secretion outer membrane protein